MDTEQMWPKDWLMKSDKQIILERQGCVFHGQEYLDRHEIDPSKSCYCGRPNKIVAHINTKDNNYGR